MLTSLEKNRSPSRPVPFDPKAVANEFLDLAASVGEALTPMKVQKLAYFAHGWHAAITDEPLLDERVEAWPFGPVIPSLYRDFRGYGDRPIASRAIDLMPSERDGVVVPVEPSLDDGREGSGFAKALVRRIWESYGGYSAVQLSNMTHEPGTPWRRIHEKYRGAIPKGTIIPFEMIRDYFREIAAPGRASR